jgi:hypothetical protein
LPRTDLLVGGGIAVLTLAVLGRTLQYLANTSFSLDEAQLALNITHRPYGELLHELDFNQGAPPVFLFLQKLAVDTFGRGEYAFRAVPFVASVLSLALMIPFARAWGLGRAAALVATVLFALSSALIFYSAVGKPYTLDVLVALVLCMLAAGVRRTPCLRQILVWTLAGALAIWFSFPAVFVLAGLGTAFLLDAVVARRWKRAVPHLFASIVWLASFGVLYLVSVRKLHHLRHSVQGSSGDGSRPTPGELQTFAGALRSDVGISNVSLGGWDIGRTLFIAALVIAAFGLVVLARRRPVVAGGLALPFVFTLAAARAGQYPLFARTLLFLVPLFAALVGYGAVFILHRPGRLVQIGTLLVLGAIVASVAAPTARHVVAPERSSELRPALRYLATNQHVGDAVWVLDATQYGLRYYLECQCFGPAGVVRRARALWPLRPAAGGADQFAPTMMSVPPTFIVSKATGYSAQYRSELRSLKGRQRVWILISEADPTIRGPVLAFLDRVGVRQAAYRSTASPTSAAVYLYNLASKR